MGLFWILAGLLIAILGSLAILSIGKARPWDDIPYWVLLVIGGLALAILILPWILQPQDPEAFTHFF
jgi:hypothetical protein